MYINFQSSDEHYIPHLIQKRSLQAHTLFNLINFHNFKQKPFHSVPFHFTVNIVRLHTHTAHALENYVHS